MCVPSRLVVELGATFCVHFLFLAVKITHKQTKSVLCSNHFLIYQLLWKKMCISAIKQTLSILVILHKCLSTPRRCVKILPRFTPLCFTMIKLKNKQIRLPRVWLKDRIREVSDVGFKKVKNINIYYNFRKEMGYKIFKFIFFLFVGYLIYTHYDFTSEKEKRENMMGVNIRKIIYLHCFFKET